MCRICQAALTEKHILTECSHQAPVRSEYYKDNNTKKLFEIAEIDKIITYLKQVSRYKDRPIKQDYSKTYVHEVKSTKFCRVQTIPS